MEFKLEEREDNCDIHGSFVSRFIPIGPRSWSKCPVCISEQLKEERHIEEEKNKKEDEDRWIRRLGKAGIPERFIDRTLDTFIAENDGQKRALDFAKDYAVNFEEISKSGRSALFIGKPGTGKTHIAAGIGLFIMKNGYSVYFSTVMRVIRRIKDSWNKNSEETETGAIKNFTYPNLLIMDEVGIQFGSEFEKNMLFDILNERYENRMPTILMSNLELEEVKSYLGERIFDRLREDGGKVIVFNWESHRRYNK